MSFQIDVDPIKCEAHGLCAELLPERITLDEWGYPLIDDAPIPASLEGLALASAFTPRFGTWTASAALHHHPHDHQ